MTEVKHRRELKAKRKQIEQKPGASGSKHAGDCKEKGCELKERAGAPVCPLPCCQKFDGGHFEWHWRVPPEWGATRSERKEGKKREQREMRRFLCEEKGGRRFATDPWCWHKSSSPMQTICQVMHHASVLLLWRSAWLCTVPIPLIAVIIRHTRHTCLSLFMPPTPHDSPCLVCECWLSSGRWARL